MLDYLGRGEIEPPHLQVICDPLYERAVRQSRACITCADVGAADLEALHRQYLNNEMRALREQQELGWTLLKQLVRSDGVSQPRLLADLTEKLGASAAGVAHKLVERRVLRRSGRPDEFDDEPTGATQLAIAHETLAQEILAHESPEEIRCKAARELVERGQDDWRKHQALWGGVQEVNSWTSDF